MWLWFALLASLLTLRCQIVQSQLQDLTREESPQLYAVCGRGHRSSLRVLRHGLGVTPVAISEMPGRPGAVWTVPASAEGQNS